MRRDKYDDGAEGDAAETFSTTTKMAASDVERSDDSTTEAVFKEPEGIFSLKEEQTNCKLLSRGKDRFAVLLTGFGKR